MNVYGGHKASKAPSHGSYRYKPKEGDKKEHSSTQTNNHRKINQTDFNITTVTPNVTAPHAYSFFYNNGVIS